MVDKRQSQVGDNRKRGVMKFVNRGYILIKPTMDFVEWANSIDAGGRLNPDFLEGNVYLIEEDFMETEPILKANFKKIFACEFEALTEDEELWPCEIKLENFGKYFTAEFGSTVLDTLQSNLRTD